MPVRGAHQLIHAAVMQLAAVTDHPHRFGGTEYRLGARELGHIHGDSLVDLPFPTAIRNELVGAGLAEPHHLLADSGWVSLYLRQPEDVDRAIALFHRGYELAQQKWRPAGRKGEHP